LLLFGVAMVALRNFRFFTLSHASSRFFTPHSELLSQLPYTETLDVLLHQNHHKHWGGLAAQHDHIIAAASR
jgi:hypothetical protein